MLNRRVTAWVLMCVFGLSLGAAAENIPPKEPQKDSDQSPSAEQKKKAVTPGDKPSGDAPPAEPKKTEPDRKPAAADDKPSGELPQAEPKKKPEPERKPDSKPSGEPAPAEPKKKTEPERKPDSKTAPDDKPSGEAPSTEPKKKTEAERKPDSKTAPDDKPSGELPQAEPKKKTEPERKPDSKAAPDDKPSSDTPAQAPAPKVEEPAKKPVTSLNLAIKLALMAEPGLFPLEIEVEIEKQKATLMGSVPSEEDKMKAGQVAKSIEGVESVVNKLTVDTAVQTAWLKKQDEAITQLIKERLNRSETLKAVGFDVKSEHGIVSLSGKTHYQVIALEAAEAARHVPGVRAVKTAGVQLIGKD